MIQKQTWKDEIRILITDEENHGSVQISIPLYVSDIFGKADALIYALWVDVVYRRNGVAQRLLQLAEQQAKLNGVKTIGLEFDKDESDRFVLDWYLRSGYKSFDKKSNLLIKKIQYQLCHGQQQIKVAVNIFLQKNLAEMKVIHYGFALSYIYMGRGTQIPVAVTFLKEALRSSSEKNCLGKMSLSNLKKIDMEELLKALLDVYIPVLNANCKKTFAFLDEYVPPPTRKERRKRERELKKKFPLDLTKFIESHRT